MKIKGFILNSRKEFVKEHFGKDGWEKVLAALSTEDQERLASAVLKALWYDFAVGERLDQAIMNELGQGNRKIFENIGRKSAKIHLTTIHKVFVRPGKYHKFMEQAPVIYNFYYNKGHRTYEETGPTSGVMTTYGAETFSGPDCLTVIGWYKEGLEMCGARNVKISEKTCRAQGGTCCQYYLSWET
jgi:hypothetical protein